MENIEFVKYLVNCPTCGKYETTGFFEEGIYPPKCELDSSHTIDPSNLTNILSYEGFNKVPQKGIQYTKQFQGQHKNRNNLSNFGPIIIEPDPGYVLEINKIDVIWHESLKANSSIVWEIQIANPLFDSEVAISSTNPTHLIVSQFYYLDFSELWGGAHKRPVSDGPTREMQHRFSDRNSRDNVSSFDLSHSMGMRVVAYSTDDVRRVDGEGTQYNTIGETKFYIPYTENTVTNGKYDISKASSYSAGVVDDIKECDDVYTLNVIGSSFLEV